MSLVFYNHEDLTTELYIKYKSKKLVSKQDLIRNTFDTYFSYIDENTAANLLDEAHSKRRFKNRLSKLEQEQIIKIFTLHDLDEVVINSDAPYFLNLLYVIDSLNNIKYIISEIYGHAETKLTYDNYIVKTDREKEQGEVFDKPLDVKEAKMHRGIIDEYKEDDIVGSLIIKSLQFTLPKELFDDLERVLLSNNKNFKKKFDKNNFTKKDLFRGFASKIFWNYAHKNYEEYKSYVIDNNKQVKKYNPNSPNYQNYRTKIDLIKKQDIEIEVIEIFNTIFKNETIKQIRTSKVEPKILALYDYIQIPTIKSVEKLETRFYELMTSQVTPVEIQKLIQQMLREQHKEETLENLCHKIRPIFY
jgi:hypothetical protein